MSLQQAPNSLWQAKEDIFDAIDADIVHKYVIDNAPDIISLISLFDTCKEIHRHYSYIFGFTYTIAHVMVNPKVIDEMNEIVKTSKENIISTLLNHVNSVKTRQNWNTQLFHDEMKEVVSDYKEYGGFNENDINKGIADQIFSDPKKIFDVSSVIHSWLENDEIASEDDLITSIFKINMPGLNKSIDDYYLLHFCRGVSFTRAKIMEKRTLQSTLYLDMMGVKLFRDKYENLRLEDMLYLYEHCSNLVSKYTDTVFTYGDFGCLCCEMHRMIDEFRKNNVQDFRNKIKEVISTQNEKWLVHKKNAISKSNLAPSIENSARSNVDIFLNFLLNHEEET